MTLKRKLQQILNVYGEDAKAGTPDYILAQFLLDCLKVFEKAQMSIRKHNLKDVSDAQQEVEERKLRF